MGYELQPENLAKIIRDLVWIADWAAGQGFIVNGIGSDEEGVDEWVSDLWNALAIDGDIYSPAMLGIRLNRKIGLPDD